MALITKDQNGNINPLEQSAVSVGLNVTQTGKELEVGGNIVSRSSPEAGGSALGFSSEPDIHGSIWTNAGYDPTNPGSGWKRTINLVNGNVGIGGSKDVAATAPSERLVVGGNALVTGNAIVTGNVLVAGDVRLSGADCAEDFDVDASQVLEPGTVMIIGDEGTLRQCAEPYDRRVAGILSGAGDCRPGIVLGKRESPRRRLPVALTGKVFCWADARYGAIQVGDLLTTSPTLGHAMKAANASRAFGAVLGKALRPLIAGKGLVPILVSLQ